MYLIGGFDMEMRKTNVWISRSLGLLFIFSSFGHLAEANSSKSQAVQKGTKNSQDSASTGRMATIGRFCKKHWYLAIPAMGAAGYVAYRLKNNSAVQKNESNSVVRKPEQPGAAQEEQSQSTNSSVGTQEESQLQELKELGTEKLISEEQSVSGDGTAKSSEPTESLISEKDGGAEWEDALRLLAAFAAGAVSVAIAAWSSDYDKQDYQQEQRHAIYKNQYTLSIRQNKEISTLREQIAENQHAIMLQEITISGLPLKK